MYSSYEIFQANKATQNYKFVTHVNATMQDVVMLAPQLMYESILKTAFDDPNFEYKVVNKVYPLTQQIESYVLGANSIFLVFCTAIAYSIIMTNIMSTVVVERNSNLKHVQLISGMRLSAYWVSNFVFDFIKIEITVIVTIIVLKGFSTGLNSSLIAYALFPFAVVPFTYCMSFLFTVDSAAQTFTMFFNFIIMLLLSVAVYVLQFIRKLMKVGDMLDWIFRIFPSYGLVDAVLFDSSGETLAGLRNRTPGMQGSVNPDPYFWKNVSFDFFLAAIQFVLWTLVLILIESGWSNKCLSWFRKADLPKNTSLVLDEDVEAEAKRVATSSERMKIKVNQLRKVYMTGIGPCNRGSPFLAVENLSFGLSAGECFALLGVNGAGKSTTFKILTSEVTATSG
jgi:ABC-type multidrug transport system fused ATPase/permease subunit